MTAIENCFSQAELALASYVNLQSGTPSTTVLKGDGKGISASQPFGIRLEETDATRSSNDFEWRLAA